MFFEVSAKCGHVGKNKYVIKQFYIKTTNAKEAARIIRFAPRVKHHQKDAILRVTEINYDEYVAGVKKNCNDLYFNIHNSSDQKKFCIEDIIDEECIEPEKKRNTLFKQRKNKMFDNISRKMILGATCNE